MNSHIEIVAEAGVNHNGSLKTALELVDAAKTAKADVVKFQTFVTEKAIRSSSPEFAVIKALELPRADFLKIARHCEDVGIEFLSTPDEVDSLTFLVEECGVKRVKIGSGDLLNWSLVSAVYRTGLPMILSTGMATMDEIRSVVAEGYDITLLHCVSCYPCLLNEANIAAMDELQEFGLPVGYSDHTVGWTTPMVAAARGAAMIEKHLTLDFQMKGPDHAMSLAPDEFGAMVQMVRQTEMLLGHGRKEPCAREIADMRRLRKAVDGLRGIAA